MVHQSLGIIPRMVHGIGGGPLIPLSQAFLWEIFPLGRRAKPAEESAGRAEPLPSAVE